MSAQLIFETAFESSDGGETVFEVRSTVAEIVSMYDAGYLEVGNIRPEHAKVVTKRGERFKRTSDRQKRWTEQLARGKGVMGNLSWNADPDDNDIEWDDEAGRLVISGRNGGPPHLTTPDSATRHRAIITAAKAPMATIDFERPVSVRVWLVPRVGVNPDDLTEPAVFDSYNQDGQPVNATVARHAYQRDDLERLVHEFVYTNRHLGLDNVETIQNTVSRESSKLLAYNTLYTAFKDGYAVDVEGKERWEKELAWLSRFWDRLVRAVPELGKVSLAQRKAYRRDSIAGSATMIHAYVRLASQVRASGLDPEVIDSLAGHTVVLSTDGLRTERDTQDALVPLSRRGDRVPYFSPDNPLWTSVGVVIAKPAADGSTSAEVRNAFQTRVAATNALTQYLITKDEETKQEALDRICRLLNIDRLELRAQSTVPAELFTAVAAFAHVDTGPMPAVGRSVVQKAGLEWSEDCDSTQTLSGGGSTVTLVGLNRLIQAVQTLRSPTR